jgi:hypothetical protein
MTVASAEGRGSRFSFSVHNGVHTKEAKDPLPFGPAGGMGFASRLARDQCKVLEVQRRLCGLSLLCVV